MNLNFGQPGTHAETFQLCNTSRRRHEDVVASLRREIDAAGMKVLNEIDGQAALASVGQTTGGLQVMFFFHPALVARLLQLDWSAMVEAPLKLAVMELPDGTVWIRMADPATAFARYGNPALAAFGQELAATCQRILAASC